MKIKCYRFNCSQCGEASSIQVFYRKDGSVGYARARHKNKQGFYYHKQSKEYVIEKLGKLSKLDQGQSSTSKTIDPKLRESSFNLGMVAGPKGFEPSTFSLEGKPGIDLKSFRDYLAAKYSKQYVSLIYGYTVKYSYCLENPQRLSELPASIRANVLKAMVNLSKFLGCYEDYKVKLKNHGIHWANGDNSFNAFLRITNNDHSTLGPWYKEASEALRPNEKLYLQFTLKSGLRKHESQTAFNRIIHLASEGRLSEYYNSETQILQHYIYPELSNRKTKRFYISIVDRDLINQIASSQPVSYYAIRKRLSLHKIDKVRIKELRSYFVSYLRQNNILPEVIDLLQGRLDIRNNIQLSHYFKIADMGKLSQQILAVTATIERDLLS